MKMDERTTRIVRYAYNVFQGYLDRKPTSTGVDIAMAMLAKILNEPLSEDQQVIVDRYGAGMFGAEREPNILEHIAQCMGDTAEKKGGDKGAVS